MVETWDMLVTECQRRDPGFNDYLFPRYVAFPGFFTTPSTTTHYWVGGGGGGGGTSAWPTGGSIGPSTTSSSTTSTLPHGGTIRRGEAIVNITVNGQTAESVAAEAKRRELLKKFRNLR